MAGKLSRFLNLERLRERRQIALQKRPAEHLRFNALQVEKAAPEELGLSSAHVQRFEAPAQAGLELATKDEESQPFVRCCGCAADSSRFSSHCAQCGADLQTPEQLAYNQTLWQARRRDQELERAVLENRATERAALERLEASQRKAQAEALAMEAGRRARASLYGSNEPLDLGHGGWSFRLRGLSQGGFLPLAVGAVVIAVVALAAPGPRSFLRVGSVLFGLFLTFLLRAWLRR